MSDLITQKRCAKCGVVKNVEGFSKNRSTRDGFDGRCKNCRKDFKKFFIDKDKEKKRSVQYYKEHRKNFIQHSKEYYEKHKDKINKYKKQLGLKIREDIADGYVLNILKIKKSDIPTVKEILKELGITLEQLIEIKRQGILAYRERKANAKQCRC